MQEMFSSDKGKKKQTPYKFLHLKGVPVKNISHATKRNIFKMLPNNILISSLVFLYAVYYLLVKRFNYWKNKEVPHLKPWPLVGNYKEYIFLKKNTMFVADEICKQFPDEPYVGVFYGTEPALIVKDPDLLKIILTKDFYYFSGREVTDYGQSEPVTNNMFFQGGDTWKVMRQNLTPLFTSSKIKKMFPLINVIGESLTKLIDEETKISPNIEIKSLLVKYTMECIMSCGFGISANLLKKGKSDNIFVAIGNSIFDSSKARSLRQIFRSIWPKLFYALRFKLFDNRLGYLFNNLLSEVFKSRLDTKSNRNDFVDLILSWKNYSFIYADSLNPINNDKKVSLEVNDELLMSQCVLFFGAGFETTSTTMSFLMYELAKNTDAQNKLIDEVDNYYKKTNGVIEYECVSEMPYLESCIDEILRLYPVLGINTREVMEDYTLPTGVKLEKGNRIHIPVYHIHHNPKYFPNPEEFIPERFFGNERKNITPYTFLPFGEGPRICIGLRFAKIIMYTLILKTLKKYRVEVCEKTPEKLEFITVSLVTQPIGDIYIKLVSR